MDPRIQIVSRLALVVAAAPFLTTTGSAQRPVPRMSMPDVPERERDQPDQPTFRAEVTRVEVSVLVVDGDGKPVRGLMAGDFGLLENGRPQAIRSFTPFSYEPEQVVLPDPVLPSPADGARSTVAASNLYTSSSRVFALILDDLHIDVRRTQVARSAARRLVEQLDPADLLFVTTTSASYTTGFFTRDRSRALRMIDDMIGQRLFDKFIEGRKAAPGLITHNMEDGRVDHYRRLTETIRDVSLALRDVTGRRKTVVLISEGSSYAAGMSDMEISMPTATGTGRVNSASGSLRLMNEALAAAAVGNVAIYPLNPVGLGTEEADLVQNFGEVDHRALTQILTEARQAKEMARDLAVLTGGVSLVDTNDPLEGMVRAVRDASEHYVLSYEPETPARGSDYRRIDVRVNRPGVRVYARRGYSAPATRPQPPLKVPGSLSPQLRTLLSGVMPDDGLPMRVEAVPIGRKGRTATVAVIVEVNGAMLAMGGSGSGLEMEQGLLTVDDRGRASNGTRRTFNVKLNPTQWEVLGASGLRSVWAVDLPPGTHQLRVGAVDAGTARGGSVYLELEIPRDEKALPGMLVASRFLALMPTVFVDKTLEPWTAAGMPTATRVFPAGDELALTVPHRGDVSGVTARLADASGRVVWQGSGSADGHTADAVRVVVPLDGLDADVCDLVVESSYGTARTTIGILSP